MIRVLVTGATGFLGSALVMKLCRSGYHVRALLHHQRWSNSVVPNMELVDADIRDSRKVKEVTIGCGAIVHLAAKVHAMDEPGSAQDYQAINVEGTRNVLEAAVSAGVKQVVFASSVKVFGEQTNGCIDESHPPAPQTFYGRSKWQAEQVVADYARRYGLAAVSLRLPMVYGPTQSGNLYRMIEAIDHGRFPALPRLPGARSLLHVDNLVQAVLLCLRASCFPRMAYIVTDAEPYCVTDLYDWLRAGLGKSSPRWRVPLWVLRGGARCGDVLRVIVRGRHVPLTSEALGKLIGCASFSPSAFTRELGYRTMYSFRETVPELIAFYRRSAGLRCSAS